MSHTMEPVYDSRRVYLMLEPNIYGIVSGELFKSHVNSLFECL